MIVNGKPIWNKMVETRKATNLQGVSITSRESGNRFKQRSFLVLNPERAGVMGVITRGLPSLKLTACT